MILFSDCMSHTLTILDDIEMYEKHKPFALGNFVTLSTVINQFLFKAIWSNLILDTGSPLFISLHSLLRYVQFHIFCPSLFFKAIYLEERGLLGAYMIFLQSSIPEIATLMSFFFLFIKYSFSFSVFCIGETIVDPSPELIIG